MISVLADVTTSNQAFFGGYGSDGYRLLFAIHILAIIAAFGPLFTSRMLNHQAIKRTGEDARVFASIPVAVTTRISMPAFIVAVLAGLGLVGASKDLYKFSQSWVSYAFSLVLVIALVYYFLLRPAQNRLVAAVQSGTPEEHATDANIRSAKATGAAATGLIHLCMVGLVLLMVWKPGL
jgi:uncharacterized membrane protein